MAKKRRKRKRRPPPQRAEAAAPAEPDLVADDHRRAATPRRRGSPEGPPPPPWGSFPLSEIVVLIALILLVAGFLVEPPRGPIMIGTGLVLGSLAGLEVSAREHFAGYRSHTLLLAGSAGMIVFAALLVSGTLGPVPSLAAGAVAGAIAAYGFANAFRRRSGGALFKAR